MGFGTKSKCSDGPADNEAAVQVKGLLKLSYALGASHAAMIAPHEIMVEDRLADICANGRCENYGLSPGCPPHVSGPVGFRELQRKAGYAIVFRMTASARTLFSDECTTLMRRLQEVAAKIEKAAVRGGYRESRAFAGGSCKKLFCHDQADCAVLSQSGECRYPDQARPSMSGFGINVCELMKRCGWPSDIRPHDGEADADTTSWVAGMVLII